MSVIVLKRKFDSVPAPADVMRVLLEQTTVDQDKAAQALEAFLLPMKDLMRLFYLIDGMKATAERHVELLTEQEALTAEVAATKSTLATEIASNRDTLVAAKTAFEEIMMAQNAKLENLSGQITTL